MRIFELDSDVDNFMSFRFLSDNDYDIADEQINNGDKVQKWKRINITPDNSDRLTENSDFPYVLSIPLISTNGKNVIEKKIMDSDVQFLEAFDIQSQETFYFLNVITAIDALNREKSIFSYFEGHLASIEEIHCRADINYPSIFKIHLTSDRLITRRIFINETLKKIFEQNKLTGFQFIEIPTS